MRLLLFYLLLSSCQQPTKEFPNTNKFTSLEVIGQSNDPKLQEVSGLAYSRKNKGLLWAHNDSGDQPQLFLINQKGAIEMTVILRGARNIDWEDMAISSGDPAMIYVGDIGDNQAKRKKLAIYRFEEPEFYEEKKITVQPERMFIQYEDGPRDAETLLLDNNTEELTILSKRDPEARMYVFPFIDGEDIIVPVSGTLNLLQLTAGDVSLDGDILLKNYDQLFYIENKENLSVADLLMNPAILEVPYKKEKQGEAITWNEDGTGFFLLSEWNDNEAQPLYYYSSDK